MDKQENFVSATKKSRNLLGNIFAPWEVNFVSLTMFPEVSKQGNIDIENITFPQQCFLVCPGLKSACLVKQVDLDRLISGPSVEEVVKSK